MADDESKRTLRTRVTTILRSLPTKKIDFRLRQWHINSSSFGKVADAIDLEIVDIDFGVVTVGGLAEYNYGYDRIRLPNTNFGNDLPFEKAVIVHECVHAYIDSFPDSRINVSANEAAGWVAYGLYLLNSGSSIRLPRPPNPSDPTPDEITLRIANKIMNIPGATVTATDAGALQNAIVNDHTYGSRGLTLYTQRDIDGWGREYSVRIASKVLPRGFGLTPAERLFRPARQ
jgi:hypothetical protein